MEFAPLSVLAADNHRVAAQAGRPAIIEQVQELLRVAALAAPTGGTPAYFPDEFLQRW